MTAGTMERPILFSGPMVRALLAGAKTQTRRVVKPVGGVTLDRAVPKVGERGPYLLCNLINDVGIGDVHCPYGRPGDRLWVRETWTAWATVGAGDHVRVEYRDGTTRDLCLADWSVPRRVQAGGWSPSIFMPRWASRITLEITDVRVERVQAISRDDAMDEGVERTPAPIMAAAWRDYSRGPEAWVADPVASFRTLWDSINATRGHGWNVNPWVWTLSFRLVAPVEAAA